MQKSLTTKNPLLSKLLIIPFTKFQNTDFLPAINYALDYAKSEMSSIISEESPNFLNTIAKYEFSTLLLDQISLILTNKNRSYTDPETQQICKEVSDLTTAFKNDVYQNQALFNKISQISGSLKDQNSLSIEYQTLTKKIHQDFIRKGALLGEKSHRFKEITLELGKLLLLFEDNLLAEKKNYYMHLTDIKDLKGLPESSIEKAQLAAKERGYEGWIFTLDEPSYIPFITYNENRDLRKKICLDYNSRCFHDDIHDNCGNVMKITELRKEKANLLGFQTHSEYILKERMAGSTEIVNNFLEKLLQIVKPRAEKEFEQLTNFAKELDGIEKLEKWDLSFYSEKLKKKLFDFDQQELLPYFPLDSVVQGVFNVANRLYGLNFLEVENIEKFCPEIKTYEVKNFENKLIAYFYTDLYPRSNKQNGGWVYTLRPRYKDFKSEEITIPHVGIFCNFPMPSKNKPSLLTFEQVETIFHEFGHALHIMLGNNEFPTMGGINVLWDFVEMPSQIMENWCYETENLELFAKHYQTNEPIPKEFIQKIKAAKNFLIGLSTLRQINYAKLDMKWHGDKLPKTRKEIKELEIENMIEFTPKLQNCCSITSFLHLFNQTYDYSSGYYGYHWAEVIADDAFEEFRKNGIFNKIIAEKFRGCILSKGATDHPMNLFREFKGREPDIEAFLKNRGLF